MIESRLQLKYDSIRSIVGRLKNYCIHLHDLQYIFFYFNYDYLSCEQHIKAYKACLSMVVSIKWEQSIDIIKCDMENVHKNRRRCRHWWLIYDPHSEALDKISIHTKHRAENISCLSKIHLNKFLFFYFVLFWFILRHFDDNVKIPSS